MGKPGRDGAPSPVRCVMMGPPLGPGGEDITWPDQVAPRGRTASSTRNLKPQTSDLFTFFHLDQGSRRFSRQRLL